MSSSTSLVPIAPAKPPPKRKRSSDLAASSETPTNPVRKPRDGPKKKKANRACFHCQKAHLTCDDSRPCQRCIKRGIANSCTEGHRKKAKYLLDEAELEQLKRNKTDAKTSSVSAAPAPAVSVENPPQPSLPVPPSDAYPPDNAGFDLAFDPNFPFGSEAANLEYSILSAILGNPSPPQDSQTSPSKQPTWPSESIQLPTHSPPFTSFPTDPSPLSYSYQEPAQPPEFAGLYHTPLPPPPSSDPLHPLQPRWPLDSRPRSPPLSPQVSLQPNNENPHGLLSPPHSNASPSLQYSNSHMSAESSKRPGIHSGSKLQSINDRITKPYDYTEGYHFLMKHLPTRCVFPFTGQNVDPRVPCGLDL
ncbi:hypothetical protein D9758_001922 [Tetrapyrgos nigripes]|uniref:Transcription activator of gluconeogenesis ERT1 n=1 Tax=Tetrapyrgos nigripes TaxID=182062 RepID=A0A8H5LV32_9AGAR|nr:hypothetical protein D9758_001922 [Tetrapyrgos nigripes]